MSLREFDRYVRGYYKRREAEIRLHESITLRATALQTAELVNIVGASAGKTYKNWRSVKAQSYFDAWTGKNDVESARERIKRAMQRSEERRKREAARRAL